MTSREHPLPHDELMAYLDGELAPDRALAVHDHLAHCVSCQTLAAELRQVSRDVARWQVQDPPVSLRAPIAPSTSGNPRWHFAWARFAGTWQFAGAAVMVVVLTSVWFASRPQYARAPPRGGWSVASGAPATPQRSPIPTTLGLSAEMADQPRAHVQLPEAGEPRAAQGRVEAEFVAGVKRIIRTVSITITARDFDAVRPAVDRILRDVSGFPGEMRMSGAPNAARSLHATLRVPAARLEEAVLSLRTLGVVTGETQSGDDVTERVVDLEARLANGRNTEKRLGEVLKNRTGDVSDVLAVEREIARVREQIERLDAERTNLERRVTYATVTLDVTEARQATLDTGPVPLSTRTRNAAVDGVRAAFESASAAFLWTLRTGPPLLLWLAILWWPARWLVRVSRSVLRT
jgi:hypothetical protein